MKISEKVMFAGKNKNEIDKLCVRLNEICHITYAVRKYLDYYLLVARNNFDYRIGLIVGNLLATFMSYDVKWLDVKNNMQDINNICICKLHMKNNKENLEKVDELVNEFKENLSNILEIVVNVNLLSFVNEYEFYIKLTDGIPGSSDELDDTYYHKILCNFTKLLNKIKSFIDEYMQSEKYTSNSSNFISIECFDITGELIATKAQIEKEETKKLKDYLKKSSFYLGLRHPEGENLAPKISTKYDLEEKFWRNSCGYRVERSKAEELKKTKNGITINSSFITHLNEEYSLSGSFGSRGRTQLNSKLMPKFKMDDTVNIVSSIEVLSDTKLVVKSDVTVSRKVEGEKLCSTPTIYDALYQNTDYKNTTFSFTVTDYYEIITNHILLHYTDFSKYYETYFIPIGFRFENGLENLNEYCEIYDDNEEEWIFYNDISEVKKYFLS